MAKQPNKENIKQINKMIEVNDYLEKNMDSIKSIIAKFDINKEFSSHDFIKKFTEGFEADYIKMLVKYQNTGRAFQTVHSLIAKYLSSKAFVLEIEKAERKESENIRGNFDIIQWWKRII